MHKKLIVLTPGLAMLRAEVLLHDEFCAEVRRVGGNIPHYLSKSIAHISYSDNLDRANGLAPEFTRWSVHMDGGPVYKASTVDFLVARFGLELPLAAGLRWLVN